MALLLLVVQFLGNEGGICPLLVAKLKVCSSALFAYEASQL